MQDSVTGIVFVRRSSPRDHASISSKGKIFYCGRRGVGGDSGFCIDTVT
jgi:hypothetical protein